MMKKKGVMFTTDALFAMTLIIITIGILFSQEKTSIPQNYMFDQANVMAEDSLKILSYTKFSQVDEALRNSIISDTNVTAADVDEDIAYIIGALWAENSVASLDYARNLTETYIGAMIPGSYSYGLFIDGQEIYSDPKTEYSLLTSSRRLISGIHEGMPTKGTSTRISISNILSKDTAKYIYFGGFVGQGNITAAFALPSVIDSVTGVYIEMDAGSNFTMNVNGNYAGYYNMTSIIPMYSHNWTMDPAYHSLFNNGENTIRINFTDKDIWNKYIGGGFIKIKYNTSQMDTTQINLNNDEVSERYIFPGVDGLFNIYSSFYVPGQLNNMSIWVHFRNNMSNTTVFLEIANSTIFFTNGTGEQNLAFTSTGILSNLTASGLNYNTLSKKTIPLRFGYYEGSFESESGYGYGDAVLITDVSGSMDWRMGFDDTTAGQVRACTNPALNQTDTQRLSVAKCVDKDFVGAMLNASGNRIGLVSFETGTDQTHQLSDDQTNLESQINGYVPQSSTCMCCGINSAMTLFSSVTNTLVDIKSEWKYTIDYPTSEPPDDIGANNWTEISYDDTAWSTGNAILGFENISWRYRIPVNISNTGADLIDYQVKIVRNLSEEYDNNKIQRYCEDIRFTYYNSTDSSETEIPFWIETCDLSNSGNATFWIKAPFLESGTNTTFYIYYGTSGIYPSSNGTATFEFFDDFDGTSLDSSRWTYVEGAYTVSGSAFHGNGGNSIEWVRTTTYQTPASSIVEFRMKPDFAPGDWDSGIGIGAAGTTAGFVDDSGTGEAIALVDTIWWTGYSDSNTARSDFTTYHTYRAVMN
ncbi:MAG: DUF2341 domain-containing protein, partial [archaeon]